MDEFETTGSFKFNDEVHRRIGRGILSESISNEETLALIKEIYKNEKYLLDPHGAVSFAAADAIKDQLGDAKLICLATAHPAKFPEIIKTSLGDDTEYPTAAIHRSIEDAKVLQQKSYTFNNLSLYDSLVEVMDANWEGSNITAQ